MSSFVRLGIVLLKSTISPLVWLTVMRRAGEAFLDMPFGSGCPEAGGERGRSQEAEQVDF